MSASCELLELLQRSHPCYIKKKTKKKTQKANKPVSVVRLNVGISAGHANALAACFHCEGATPKAPPPQPHLFPPTDKTRHARTSHLNNGGIVFDPEERGCLSQSRGRGGGGRPQETEAYFFLLWIEDDMFYSRKAQSSERIIRSLVEVRRLRGEA